MWVLALYKITAVPVQKMSREAQGEPRPALIFWIVMNSGYSHWASVWHLSTSDPEVDQQSPLDLLSQSQREGLWVPNQSTLFSSLSSSSLKVTSAPLTRSGYTCQFFVFLAICSPQTTNQLILRVWFITAPWLWVLRMSCVGLAWVLVKLRLLDSTSDLCDLCTWVKFQKHRSETDRSFLKAMNFSRVQDNLGIWDSPRISTTITTF